MSKFQSKNIILTKKINNVIYEMMVKTTSDMVYTDQYTTLTETIDEIYKLLTEYDKNQNALEESFKEIFGDAPETFRTFKEVWDYVNVNGDPKSELIKMIEGKQNAEEGKGLSTHDFDDILYAKLKYGYSKEELDEKFFIIVNDANKTNEKLDKLTLTVETLSSKPNIIVSENVTGGVNDYSCWYQIVSRDGK